MKKYKILVRRQLQKDETWVVKAPDPDKARVLFWQGEADLSDEEDEEVTDSEIMDVEEC